MANGLAAHGGTPRARRVVLDLAQRPESYVSGESVLVHDLPNLAGLDDVVLRRTIAVRAGDGEDVAGADGGDHVSGLEWGMGGEEVGMVI